MLDRARSTFVAGWRSASAATATAARRPALAAAFLALLTLFVAGCGPRLVPFTHELRVQNNLTDRDLKNLQFYVSHRVALRREIESGGSQITSSHKLLLVLGKTIEEVIVEEHTPGVAVSVSGGSIAVSFEPGASLLFAAAGEPGAPAAEPQALFATPPDPFPGNGGANTGQLPARAGGAFGGSYWLSTTSGAQVSYQGKLFSAIDESLKAHLLIDADSLEEVVEDRKVLPGVRLSDR
jgi:hypothetical protein